LIYELERGKDNVWYTLTRTVDPKQVVLLSGERENFLPGFSESERL